MCSPHRLASIRFWGIAALSLVAWQSAVALQSATENSKRTVLDGLSSIAHLTFDSRSRLGFCLCHDTADLAAHIYDNFTLDDTADGLRECQMVLNSLSTLLHMNNQPLFFSHKRRIIILPSVPGSLVNPFHRLLPVPCNKPPSGMVQFFIQSRCSSDPSKFYREAYDVLIHRSDQIHENCDRKQRRNDLTMKGTCDVGHPKHTMGLINGRCMAKWKQEPRMLFMVAVTIVLLTLSAGAVIYLGSQRPKKRLGKQLLHDRRGNIASLQSASQKQQPRQGYGTQNNHKNYEGNIGSATAGRRLKQMGLLARSWSRKRIQDLFDLESLTTADQKQADNFSDRILVMPRAPSATIQRTSHTLTKKPDVGVIEHWDQINLQ